MSKIRVLYPLAFAGLPNPPAAGDVIELDEAAAFIAAGYAEPVGSKGGAVERAVATPGVKRPRGRPRKNPPPEAPPGAKT